MSDLPLLAAIAQRLDAEVERLRRLAASGAPGCVAYRQQLTAVRHEQLRCTATGWRGAR